MNDGTRLSATKPAADYGIFLLAIPVIASVVVWVWVPQMNLLQSPSDVVTMISMGTIFGTAAVAAMEAKAAGMVSDRSRGTYGPGAWFFIVALLWFVGYPAYLLKRRHFGLANRLAAGLVVALIFLGSVTAITVAIESKKADIRSQIEGMQKDLSALSHPDEPPSSQIAQSPQPTAGWSQEFKQQVFNGCAKEAMQKGDSQEVERCRCVIEKISASIPEQSMSEADSDLEIQAEISRISASCAESSTVH